LFCARSTREAASLYRWTAGYPQATGANFLAHSPLSRLTLQGALRTLAAPLRAPSMYLF
jgi:hypothetical protein